VEDRALAIFPHSPIKHNCAHHFPHPQQPIDVEDRALAIFPHSPIKRDLPTLANQAQMRASLPAPTATYRCGRSRACDLPTLANQSAKHNCALLFQPIDVEDRALAIFPHSPTNQPSTIARFSSRTHSNLSMWKIARWRSSHTRQSSAIFPHSPIKHKSALHFPHPQQPIDVEDRALAIFPHSPIKHNCALLFPHPQQPGRSRARDLPTLANQSAKHKIHSNLSM